MAMAFGLLPVSFSELFFLSAECNLGTILRRYKPLFSNPVWEERVKDERRCSRWRVRKQAASAH